MDRERTKAEVAKKEMQIMLHILNTHAQINSEEEQKILHEGKRIIREIECPHCGGKAVVELYSHDWCYEKGIGIRSYCEDNACYNMMT